MPTGHSIQPSPLHAVTLPVPGTIAGNAAYEAFVGELYKIGGDLAWLWLPKTTDTTTSTDASYTGATITHAVSLAGRVSALGSGVAVTFDGTNDTSTIPDSNLYSFGDSANDQSFTLFSLVKPNNTASMAIVSKWKDTATAAREYLLWFQANKYPSLELYDESASAIIARADATALVATTWQHITGTYDGSRATSGIRVWLNKNQTDDGTGATTGTYVAMENSAQVVRIGATTTATFTNIFAGSMAMVGAFKSPLTQVQVAALVRASNAFHGLST